MKPPLLRSFLVVAASVLLLASTSRAAVEFSDFGQPGNTYNTGVTVLVDGAAGGLPL